jgi:hyperosmotically inducible protein
MKHYFTYVLVAPLLAGTLAFGQQPDNTKTNKRDKEMTTQEQSATVTKDDLETLRKIRKAVTSDKSLSTYAHNVKITVKNGAVELRGPVRSSEEKARIEELAKTNGGASVTNQLEIAPPK